MTQMLIEFETLDNEDLQKILNKEWSIVDKKRRLQEEIDRHKRVVT